ncbi:AT-rich interactive domain-containing protein 2-like [Typha latifolia]|uniref:AT-rich interactive domain-containing protein 2-like n=1 Tax=Typha latifolia TaxID=4733 RepID=UPI003C2E63BF
MAGWSLPRGFPNLDVVDILSKLQSAGFCSDVEIPTAELTGEKLGPLFDQVLSVFLKEIYQTGEIRPLPPLLGDGQPVDLFKLYWVVREKGGYDSVSENRRWVAVSEAIGFGSELGSSIKLVYAKYLATLDRWFQQVLDKKAGGDRVCRKNDSGQKKKDCKVTSPSSKKDQFLTPVRENKRRLQLDNGSISNGHAASLDKAFANGGSHLKRKRESLVGMLNWVRNLAKNVGDPSIVGKLFLSDGAKSKSHVVAENIALALMARQAMFVKQIPNTSPLGSLEQNGQNIHHFNNVGPSSASQQTKGKTRYSQRLQSLTKQSNSGFCSEKSAADDEMGDKTSTVTRKGSTDIDDLVGWLPVDQQQKVRIGPSFQVKVPDWSGKSSVSCSDPDSSKWLGTRIWPPENQENRASVSYDPIGKGREDECMCTRPGSVDCVRFHVAEKRFRLKRELGSAFYAWGFDRMGEEVALSWTEEEERKFKAIVRLNPPSLEKNYWDQLYRCFPSKSRKKLVSYYFNVFLLGRRSYQNRVTPSNIDSDDEETEFGFLCYPFGHGAVRFCDSKSTVCVHNTQCVDLDD